MDANKLNRHLKTELMTMDIECSKGCKQTFKYDDYHIHEDTCDGTPKGGDQSTKEFDKERNKNILFVLDKDKPELLRYDTIRNSRIKIAVVYTQDSQ
mmetsp:Transcript_3464/g.2929  ORF Transcript_3464/g.2929 Transcript_3464/m.2929 type:complete len:97 (+) Transcript_3464:172-462(+)